MKKCKSTKRALVMSVLALLTSVAMLVGSTFAWFTDSVATGMNTIAAGNLDIELLVDGDTKVDSATKLFDDVTHWEPGVVVYENLQIANVGTLALQYQMSLNFGNENDLNGHKLSEVLQIAVVDAIADGATRYEVLTAAKASTNVGTLSDFIVSGTLIAGEKSTEQAIVIFWEPNDAEIDNLYNANNEQVTSDGQPLHIEFGVNLVATQLTYEEDSFDNQYDAETVEPSIPIVTVTSADELAAALANITEETIIDATGVVVNLTAADPYHIPAGVTLKGVTFNSNYRGHNYIMYSAGVGEQVVFENCSFGNTSRTTVLGGDMDGCASVVYNGCAFNGQILSSYVDNTAGVAEFNNCTFTKSGSGTYHFMETMGGTHNFNACTFDYTGVSQTSMGVITSGQINVYSEDEYTTVAVLTDCKFINCGRRTYGPNSTLTIQ